jgi:frataxin
MPDTENPAKPPAGAEKEAAPSPVELTETEYHEVADQYLDHVLAKFEEIQDQADEIDVEFSVCPFPSLDYAQVIRC